MPNSARSHGAMTSPAPAPPGEVVGELQGEGRLAGARAGGEDGQVAGAQPAAQRPLKVFISVDMEGIGGIGTSAMTTATGKDYATGRRLMTDRMWDRAMRASFEQPRH